jgi:hypothetical protein
MIEYIFLIYIYMPKTQKRMIRSNRLRKRSNKIKKKSNKIKKRSIKKRSLKKKGGARMLFPDSRDDRKYNVCKYRTKESGSRVIGQRTRPGTGVDKIGYYYSCKKDAPPDLENVFNKCGCPEAETIKTKYNKWGVSSLYKEGCSKSILGSKTYGSIWKNREPSTMDSILMSQNLPIKDLPDCSEKKE